MTSVVVYVSVQWEEVKEREEKLRQQMRIASQARKAAALRAKVLVIFVVLAHGLRSRRTLFSFSHQLVFQYKMTSTMMDARLDGSAPV